MKKTKKILFVCTGNSCRSVMAEALLKRHLEEAERIDIKVSSAGTGAIDGLGPTENTIEVMSSENIDVSGHKTRALTENMVRESDLILVMENFHREEILDRFPAAASKTFLLRQFNGGVAGHASGDYDILDPIGHPLKDYEYILKVIKTEIERVTPHLLK